jgi:sugar lactone lactonase YvrE
MNSFARTSVLGMMLLSLGVAAHAQSVISTRLDDPAAVYLTPQDFGVRADGVADDSAGLQAAIDKAAALPNGGILFVPSGRYRITRTIYLWRAVRVIGYGDTRPVLVLGANTPGYQKGIGLMVMFTNAGPPGGGLGGPAAGGPPGGRGGAAGRGGGPPRVPFSPIGQVPPRDDVPDASPVTFYSAMSNLDVEIGDGNPAAVAIRFHVAQHAYLNHMNLRIGSGLAGIMQAGNEVEDLHFTGGRYGIITENTSPFWQFTAIDTTFEGQREAAIREHMVQLTLIRTSFRNVPVAIDIDPQYSDQVWVKDSRFENVSKAVIQISNEQNPSTAIGFENAECANVPVFARFRESGRTQAGPAPVYRVANYNYGLFVTNDSIGRFDSSFSAAPLRALPAALPPAMPPLPPASEWVNVHTLGVKGDGKADDTEAIAQAIASHRVLYFPLGYYVVRKTLLLKPDTVLIGLHSQSTQLLLPDSTPGFQGVGAAQALVEAPPGGAVIVSGLGLHTGGVNPRATAIKWMSGERSLMYDVQINNGGYLPPDTRTMYYNAGAGGRGGPANPFAAGRWGAQFPSIWVTQGGGTFANVWSANTLAQAGFYVSDTTTPGHVYEMSVEHHMFNEIKLDRVENWDINSPQTEEEAPSSPESVSFEINDSKNIAINNYHAYRVTRSHAPFPAAARVSNSTGIRFRNVRVNAESGYGTCDENGCGTFLRVSKFPYDNAVEDMKTGRQVREHEFAVFDFPPAGAAPPASTALVVQDGSVRAVASGFHAISGAAAGPDGTLYFVDPHQQRIFAWSQARGLVVVRHDALDAVNLAVDKSGNLLVQSSAGSEGTVFSFRPGTPLDQMTVLAPQANTPHPGASFVLPANVWDNGEFKDQLDADTLVFKTNPQMFAEDMTAPRARAYVSPDGSLVLPHGRVFRQGPDDNIAGMDPTGWRWSNNLNAYGFLTAAPGAEIYVVSSAENRTYKATVRPDGSLGDLRPFAERGGEGVAWDRDGNVYVANGQIFVYDRTGKAIGRIDAPERPVQLLFGGPDRRTLFILGHHALYAVKTKASGS